MKGTPNLYHLLAMARSSPNSDMVKVNNNWDANWAPMLEIDIFPSRTRAIQFEYFGGQGVQKIDFGGTRARWKHHPVRQSSGWGKS
jgi:hypothetical protein